jgi:DNA polymerase V
MTDLLVLDLVDKALVTNQIVLTIGYDIENLTNPDIQKQYRGEITTDRYGRKVPKHAHGTINLDKKTSSSKMIIDAVLSLYDRIVNKKLLVRRITVCASHVEDESTAVETETYEQLQLFRDYDAIAEEKMALEKEKKLQHAILDIKKKYGKNAILKGINLEEGATARERNNQIGGHKA